MALVLRRWPSGHGRRGHRRPEPRRATSPSTSSRRATTAACRRPRTRATSCRSTTVSRRCAATSPTPTSTATSCPRTSQPVGATHEEVDRPARLRRSSTTRYGVPHVTGETRADVAFGAGWVTARDRGLLIQLGRGPARVAVADVPGIDAFSLVTSGQSFVPSAQTEPLVTDQQRPDRPDLRRQGPRDHRRRPGRGRRHQRVLDGAQHRPAAGDRERRHRGHRVHRLDLRRRRRRRGDERRVPRQAAEPASARSSGHKAWDDAMLFDDPEAPTTTKRDVRLRPAHRRSGHRLGDDRRGLDRPARSAVQRRSAGPAPTGDASPGAGSTADRSGRRPGAAASRRRTSSSSPRGGRPPATRSR